MIDSDKVAELFSKTMHGNGAAIPVHEYTYHCIAPLLFFMHFSLKRGL
jgi:hypothetical protein